MLRWWEWLFYPICSFRCDGLVWVRFFGFGFVVKDTEKHYLNFSERNGFQRVLRMGHYVAVSLTPW